MEIITCIPTNAADHKDFLRQIGEKTSGDYLFTGQVPMRNSDEIAMECTVSAKDPYYRITKMNDWIYSGHDLFENPFGRYKLEPNK